MVIGADELGAGEGFGYNRNFPLPHGTTFAEYEPHFNEAISMIKTFDPKRSSPCSSFPFFFFYFSLVDVIISLGLDAAAGDPICEFLLHPPDYLKMATAIKALGILFANILIACDKFYCR